MQTVLDILMYVLVVFFPQVHSILVSSTCCSETVRPFWLNVYASCLFGTLFSFICVAVILNEGFNFLCLFAYIVTSSRMSALTLLKRI